MTNTRRAAMDRPIKNISNRIKGRLVFRVVLGILTAMLTMGIVLLLLAYSWFSHSLYDVYKGNLERVASNASVWFDDGELEDIIREGADSEAYREMQAELINYCKWQDLIYISIIMPSADYTQETFYFDVVYNADIEQYEPFSTHPLHDQSYINAYKRIYEEGSYQETVTKSSRESDSPYMTIIVPIFEEYNDETEMVARPYWNRGICTEALRMVIDYCFEKKGFNAIWADYFPENPASGKVMEKCGFCDTTQ